jgi:hypothetical protein
LKRALAHGATQIDEIRPRILPPLQGASQATTGSVRHPAARSNVGLTQSGKSRLAGEPGGAASADIKTRPMFRRL